MYSFSLDFLQLLLFIVLKTIRQKVTNEFVCSSFLGDELQFVHILGRDHELPHYHVLDQITEEKAEHKHIAQCRWEEQRWRGFIKSDEKAKTCIQ